jgi:hypothetical protein
MWIVACGLITVFVHRGQEGKWIMGDEQGTLFTLSPDRNQQAIEAELARIVQVAERVLNEGGSRDLRLYAYRIVSAAVPGMTRERWAKLATRGWLPAVEPRTCECVDCDEPECQGDCDMCEDHENCEQCYGGHSAYSCCGYCPDCDSHMGDGRDDVCDRGHCHDCGHRCDQY